MPREEQIRASGKKLPRALLSFFLPALTSLLLVLSYPKFNLGFLAWAALTPLAFSIFKSRSRQEAFLKGTLSGFLFYAGILYWIYFTMRAGGVGFGVSVLGWLGLSLILSLEFAAVSFFGFYLSKTGLAVFPYVFACLWTTMEWIKMWLSAEAVWFPWFMLGYTQWEYPVLIQICSLFGVSAISFALAFSGALLGMAFVRREKFSRKALKFIPLAVLISSLWIYGGKRLAERTPPRFALRAAILQPSIDFYKKWDEKYVAWIEKRIEGLFDRVNSADLIIWPENALPGWIDDEKYSGWIKKLAAASEASNIVGSVSLFEGKHVSSFLINEKGERIADYHKRELVPFGEYVPMKGLLGKFVEPVAELGEFRPGKRRQNLFEVRDVKIANFICYESIFPFLLYADASKGAGLFVNITNDGWYLDTAAPYQHFIVNVFRAVENGKPVLRAANNGISAYINPWGIVMDKLDINEYSVLEADVEIPESETVNRSEGFYLICLMITAAFLIAALLL